MVKTLPANAGDTGYAGSVPVIMGWGVVSEETPVSEKEIKAFDAQR